MDRPASTSTAPANGIPGPVAKIVDRPVSGWRFELAAERWVTATVFAESSNYFRLQETVSLLFLVIVRSPDTEPQLFGRFLYI
jgi:hypothetical protein